MNAVLNIDVIKTTETKIEELSTMGSIGGEALKEALSILEALKPDGKRGRIMWREISYDARLADRTGSYTGDDFKNHLELLMSIPA